MSDIQTEARKRYLSLSHRGCVDQERLWAGGGENTDENLMSGRGCQRGFSVEEFVEEKQEKSKQAGPVEPKKRDSIRESFEKKEQEKSRETRQQKEDDGEREAGGHTARSVTAGGKSTLEERVKT